MKKLSALLLLALMLWGLGFNRAQAQCYFSNYTAADTPTLYLWASPSMGYLSGNGEVVTTNSYPIDSLAEEFDLNGGFVIQGVNLYFAYTTINPADSNSIISVDIWDTTGTGVTGGVAPGGVHASASISLKQVAEAVTLAINAGTLVPVYVPFSQPDTVHSAHFFAGISLPATTGDTVVMFTTTGYTPRGLGFVQLGGAGWMSYDSLITGIDQIGDYIQLVAAGCPQPINPPVAAFGDSIFPNCFGATVSFYDSSTNQPIGWSWNFPGGTPSSSNAQNPVVSYPAAGVYPVTLQVVNALGGNTITNNITVSAIPVYTSSYEVTSPVCIGQNSSITYTGNAPPGATYNWVFTNGTPATGNTQGPYEISWDSAGAYNINLYVTYNGCNSGVTDQLVIVTPTPTSTFTAASPVCIGSDAAITYTGNASDSAIYSWNFAGGTVVSGTGQGPYEVTWPMSGTENVTLSVTENGCASVLTTVPVTVSTAVGPVIDSFVTHSAACAQDSGGSICVYESGGTPPFDFFWSNLGLTFSSCISNLSPGVYACEISDSQGCTAIGYDTVGQIGPPVIDTIVTTPTTCPGNNGSACAQVTGGGGHYKYVWAPVSDSTSCISNLSPGVYEVTVTDTSGCSASASASIAQSNNTGPVIDSIVAQNIQCAQHFPGFMCVYVSDSAPPLTYAWSTGAASQCIYDLFQGAYWVTVTDAHGCTALASDSVLQIGAPVIDSIVTTLTTCSGSNGSACVYVSGGGGEYKYYWNNNAQTSCISNLAQGLYYVTVSDTTNCTVTGFTTIVSGPPVSITTARDTICAGDSTVISGPAGYAAYLWNTGAPAQNITTSYPGNYVLTVTNAQGCMIQSNQLTIHVYAPTAVTIALNGDTLTSYTVEPAYQWYFNGTLIPGATNQVYIALQNGDYNLAITDSNGCHFTSSPIVVTDTGAVDTFYTFLQHDTIMVNTVINLCYGSVNPSTFLVLRQPAFGTDSTFSNSNGTCIAYTPNVNFMGNDTFSFQFCFNFAPYTCDTEEAVITVDSNCYQCVWPGDANEDGVVNNLDLLPIGLAYDSTGPLRPNATINWTGQPASYWPDSLADSTNYKFIDCNGDGIINASDTNAIALNYFDTHTRGGSYQQQRNNVPELAITFNTDTFYDGETAIATLSLGDSANPATNVYGLAFTFNYDQIPVDSSSINMSFGSSWLFQPADYIALSKTFAQAGYIEGAATRIDHQMRTGYGPIGQVSMKITTGNINGKTYSYYNFKTFISALTVIDNIGNVKAINEGSDSAQVGYYPTGIIEPGENTGIRIFPNPANDQLFLTSDNNTIASWQIIDMLGKTVAQNESVNANAQIINISSLSQGTYIVNIMAGNNQLHSRFIKAGF